MRLGTGSMAMIGALLVANRAPAGTPLVFPGRCDGSAAASIGGGILVDGNDENQMLRLYRVDGQPLGSVDVSAALGLGPTDEADIEAAARIDDRIYWITSHGRDKRGDASPERHRFFATDILRDHGTVTIVPVGMPATGLADAMLAASATIGHDFTAAMQRAPEAEGGFNIEGLAALPDGGLLIGLRNPLTADGKAIAIPLRNPGDVIAGKPARFGAAIAIDLKGNGIRSIDADPDHGGYVIVAGGIADGGAFAAWRWNGDPASAPVPLPVDLTGMRPEALVFPGGGRMLFLSDDGSKACKKAPEADKRFSGLLVP